jgi:succinate dehydrogenase/fumarate reductase-like Fe-S protein
MDHESRLVEFMALGRRERLAGFVDENQITGCDHAEVNCVRVLIKGGDVSENIRNLRSVSVLDHPVDARLERGGTY